LSRKHAGTGLGLALSKRLVEMHGGTIVFEPRDGGGTSFTATLPVTAVAGNGTRPGPEAPKTAGQFPGTTSAGKKIMLVEDNQLNMLLASDFLKTKSFQVMEAENGEMALEKAAQKRPDLILLDIQMPGIDGFEVLNRLREDPELQTIPVIAMTALAMKGDEERCMQAGFNDYISKPVNLQEMLEKISRILKRSQE
jgi:CheY-like chemotaxis protein